MAAPPARISSLEPPRGAYPPQLCCARLTNVFHFCCHFTRCSFYVIACVNQPLTAADLRLASLIARGIRSNLSHHADDPTFAPCAARAPSTRVLCDADFDGYCTADIRTLAPSTPLRFLATARRAHSSSRASAGAALEMPTLAATLLLHRREAPAPRLYASDRGRASVADPRLRFVALKARSTSALATFLRLNSERSAAKCGLNCSVRTRSLARTPATGFTFTRCASAAFASHFPYHIRTRPHLTPLYPRTQLSTTLSA
ncbi:hypothetical protein B0H14DRAFT_3904946 [Mycena olivaceomarginata]|nr:hypothetical protein B0H14DRAFT_3904946 [Mycena olivaceomarginata]